jgi:hypothetical protein
MSRIMAKEEIRKPICTGEVMQKENIIKYAILSRVDGQESREIRVYRQERYEWFKRRFDQY